MSDTLEELFAAILGEPEKPWIANCQRCGRFCHGRTIYYESTGEWDDVSECAPGKGCKREATHEGGSEK